MKPNSDTIILRPLIKNPITRDQLKKYAQASTDPNQIHLDDSVAQAVGLKGVIAHGMLTMAFMGEFLYQAIGDHASGKGRIEEFSCRFKSMTFPDDTISIFGESTKISDSSDRLFKIELEAKNQNGEITATGTAIIKLK